MKTRLTLSLLAVAGIFLLTGCSGIHSALRVTQQIEGSGSVTTTKPYGVTVAVTVENARQEDDRYKADKIDIVATSPLGKTEIHATDYSRPLIPEKQ